MIKRKYFFSVKVSHDDGSGKYSWWNGILNTRGWAQDKDELLIYIRDMAVNELHQKVSRKILT